MHFIASASHAITEQHVSQLYPSVSPLDVTTGFKKLSEETSKQAATFFFFNFGYSTASFATCGMSS